MRPIIDPRAQQGDALKTNIMALRRARVANERLPWKHPFGAIHSSTLHEAGHAVLASAFGRKLENVSILKEGLGDGVVDREIRESSPRDTVEEILIKFAGYEAAWLYGHATNDIYDMEDVAALKERLPEAAALDEDGARKCVCHALMECRDALEDLAAPLFTLMKMSGDEVSAVIAEKIPESAKRLLTEGVARLLSDCRSVTACLQRGRLLQRSTGGQKPILLLGWGEDGAEDAKRVRKYLDLEDKGIVYATKPRAGSREVLKVLREWLQGNSCATLLYIGAHGFTGKTSAGIVQKDGKSKVGISYRELAREIRENMSPSAERLCVCLGACKSAKAVSAFESLPIQLLVVFPEEPTSYLLQKLIVRVIAQMSLLSLDNQTSDRPITDLADDVEELRQMFPEARIYRKSNPGVQLVRVDDEAGIQALREELDARN